MPQFSQENSPLKVFTPLPEGTLLATRLSGWERLGDSFEFTLDLLAPKGASVSFGDLLGKSASASVTQASGVVRHYHGEIWEFTQNDSDDLFDHYLMVLRPRLARARGPQLERARHGAVHRRRVRIAPAARARLGRRTGGDARRQAEELNARQPGAPDRTSVRAVAVQPNRGRALDGCAH